MRQRPLIAVSMGDPRGIGAEVVVRALANPTAPHSASFVIYGDPECLAAAAKAAGCPHWDRSVAAIHVAGADGGTLLTHVGAGEASFRWVEAAARLTLLPSSDSDHADALVTAPISKAAWFAAGHAFPGHTELLAAMCGVPDGDFAMMFHAATTPTEPGINVILATVHVPLAQVANLVTFDRVLGTIRLAAQGMREIGVANPRLAVCGLNPHAGEDGLLGSEDAERIAPAVARAKAEGINVSGPFPADTIFRRALNGAGRTADFDCVVAMYHDQGLAPLKTLAMERAVNRTVGLPIIRTSPDHGTAFDIAGNNAADPRSMIAALHLAIGLAATRLHA